MNKKLTFTIFGGTGDLTFRKLLPALYNMSVTSKTESVGQVIIIGRRDYTSEQYRMTAMEWVEKFARLSYTKEDYDRLAAGIFYYKMDFTDEKAYTQLNRFYKEMGAGSHIFYFAVAPRFFSSIVTGLAHVEQACHGKVVLEKPFGENLTAAKELNEKMESFFCPDNIYRIDHYLGKEMVRNIQTIRFANPIFSGVWDARHIECIQISALEEVGVETRGSYYDHSGAMKDMVQNHLFQILSIVAMEQPGDLMLAGEEMHREQIRVLSVLHTPETIEDSLVLGQYKGYREEKAVEKDSLTESYAAMRIFLDTDRWRGMPFYIRTGKKLGHREMQVLVVFKPAASHVQANILNIKIQPTEGVYLQFNIKKPGEEDDIAQAKMDFCQSCSFINQMNTPEAYERLLGACVRGERFWFSQWDQIEASWKYVDEIRKRYHDKKLPVYEYEAGSYGPRAAEEMLKKSGDHWLD